MADSSVTIQAAGSTAIDTRTEATNGDHRQVVVLGDPSTTAGVAPVSGTNGLSVTLTTALPAGSNAIGSVTNTSFAATQSGTWTVTGAGGTFPVTGTFWQATQPVSLASLPALATGSNAIGSITNTSFAATQATGSNLHTVVDSGTITTVAAVTAITNALPAGTNLLGVAVSPLQTGAVYSGTTALTPKFATISASSSGVSTLVAAVASKKIRVLSYRFQADADVSVKFRDNTAAVDLTGAMATGAKGGGGGAAFSPVGHFETASGNALSINLSGAVQVSGHVAYIEV